MPRAAEHRSQAGGRLGAPREGGPGRERSWEAGGREPGRVSLKAGRAVATRSLQGRKSPRQERAGLGEGAVPFQPRSGLGFPARLQEREAGL